MRRFEFRDDGSAKFWEIETKGTVVSTRWGRLGSDGTTTLKDVGSEAKAAVEAEKQIRGKVSKGYVEVGEGAAAVAPAKASDPAKAAASAKDGAAKDGAAKNGAAKNGAAKNGTAKVAASAQAEGATKGSATAKASARAAGSAKAKASSSSSPASPAASTVASTSSTPASVSTAAAALDDIPDGGEATVSGSGSSKYVLRNTGGVYSCTCPAWRNQSVHIDRRTCKHLRRFRGEAAEEARLGALPVRAAGSGGSTSGADAPPLLLAHRWEQQDPTGWWMSEKLDGVRAYWDGKRFVSRLGNQYVAPAWFVEGLPDFPLDGELFAGRGRFQQAVSVARRMDAGEAWRALSFVIFDAPAVDAGFEDRIAHLEAHFTKRPFPLARVLDHRPCKGHDDLAEELRRIEELGGEGLMLRRPGSRYEVGRSETLLKVKSFLDTEARIVGHQPGTGRHKGRLGAFEVELPDGTRFKVGTGMSDAERERPLPVGEVITVRYQELTDAGVPRFPTYVGPRADASWEVIVAAWNEKGDG
jgi:DNA ligase-1